MEHLHPRRPAAHSDCHARQGVAVGRRAAGCHARPVLCGQGRWRQPLQHVAGGAQPCRQPLPTRPAVDSSTKVFMSRPGLFITFEGIDGAGKSSHIEGLAAAFRAQGRAVTVSREPGGTPLAEKLREMVLNDPMDALTESLLIFAARRDHLRNVIEPALARGDVVLCDRFTDATFAYQGAGRGFDLDVLSILERIAQTGHTTPSDLMREPDLTVWFDLAPEVAAERLAGARVPDRFEAQPVEFFRRVAQGYADRAAAAPQRFARLDAAQDRHRVWQQLTSVFVRKGWLAIMVASQGGAQWASQRWHWRRGLPRSAPACWPSAATRGCCRGHRAWASTPWVWSWCGPGCAMRPQSRARAVNAAVATPSTCAPTPICVC